MDYTDGMWPLCSHERERVDPRPSPLAHARGYIRGGSLPRSGVFRETVFLGVLLASCAVFAAPPVKEKEAAASAPVRDYAAGFAKFYELGLPRTRGARYVKLTLTQQGPGDYTQLGDRELYNLKLKGNAWLLKEDNARGSLLLIGDTRLVRVIDKKSVLKPAEVMETLRKEDPSARLGTWEPADIAKDLAAIEKFLAKSEKDDELDWMYRQGSMGTLFLKLCHYHTAGYTNEANRLAGALLGHAPKPRAFLLNAVGKLAQNRYDEVCSTFFRNGNWTHYHAEMTGLLGTFRNGWGNAPAVERLAERVAERVAQKAPPVPEAGNLDAADRQLVDALAVETGEKLVGERGLPAGVWVLDFLDDDEEPNEAEPVPMLHAALRRRMACVPVLVSLLGDTCFTLIDRQSMSGSSHHFSGRSFISHSLDDPFADSGGLDDSIVDSLYDAIRRPLTRGEIARRCLAPVVLLPGGERYGHSDMDDDSLREECRTWYERCKEMGPKDLARIYMAEGTDSQKHQALALLRESDDAKDRERVETYFIKEGGGAIYYVREYVSKLGPDAGGFLSRYAAAVTGTVSDAEGGMFKNKSADKRTADEVKKLWDIVNARPADQILEDVLDGKTNLASVTSILNSQLARGDRKASLSLLLGGASRATNANLCGSLISMGSSLIQSREWRHGPEGSRMVMKKDRPRIEDHAELWRKLLEDRRVIDNKGWSAQILSVADSAASVIENGYCTAGTDDDDFIDIESCHGGRSAGWRTLGRRGLARVRERAAARLEGTPEAELPKLPAPGDLSDDEKEALAARLEQSGKERIRETMAALSMDELLVLAEVVGTNKTLNALLAPMSLEITAVQHPFGEGGEGARLDALKGKTMSIEVARNLAELCRKTCSDGHSVMVAAQRGFVLDGVTLVVRRQPLRDDADSMQRVEYGVQAGTPGMVAGSVSARRKETLAEWPLVDPVPAAAAPPTREAGIEDALLAAMAAELDREYERLAAKSVEDFWSSVGKALQSREQVCTPMAIRFRADEEKREDE